MVGVKWILLDCTVYAWLRNVVYVLLYWSGSEWEWKPTNVMIEAEGAMS